MDPICRKCMIRRIAAARRQSCYIENSKLIVEQNVEYTWDKNDIFFNLVPLSDDVARQIDEVVKGRKRHNKMLLVVYYHRSSAV